jgi:hypothetical protein
MSIGWIILGILALGVLGILAIYFFYVLEESYAKWSWPKVLVVSTIIAIAFLLIGQYFGL